MTDRESMPGKCPTERVVDLIGGRWKAPILWRLAGKSPLRFSELRRGLAACSQKVLTQQLRQMEADGLIRRKIYAQVPPRVEYSLTARGRSLAPILRAMCRWEKCRGR